MTTLPSQIDLSNIAGLRATMARARRHVVPPPDLLPSEWVEQHVRIPQSNALPGPVRFRNAPYQREPLDQIVDPDTHTVTLMFGAQTGKTQIQLMAIGYHIAHKAANQIVMQPTQSDLEAWLTMKLDAMIDSTPAIKRKMAPPRGREGVNNKKMKQYIGGSLMFAWSGSPSTMRGKSAPKIYCDEVDGYERLREGSAVSLLANRNKTFGDDRLLFLTSTPTEKHLSAIESYWLAGDQRRWWVPCSSCGHHQVLRWEQVQWVTDDDGTHHPGTAAYCCESCGVLWTDAERYRAIRAGEWRASRPFDGHASYHLPSMASLFVSLEYLAREFLQHKHNNDLQTFVNTTLGEPWEEPGEAVEPHALMSRAEPFPDAIPERAFVLTMGVDVQQDRIEAELVAWGQREESWSIEHMLFPGDPAQDDVWTDLKAAIAARYPHQGGQDLAVSAVCVDSGYLTKRVYEFCAKTGEHVIPVKGVSGQRPFVESLRQRLMRLRKRRRTGVKPEVIGVDEGKALIYRRLRAREGEVGRCHFPDDRDREWYDQLTAEKIVTRYRKGAPVREWIQTRPRNEALDCRVYAYAALLLSGIDLEREAARLSGQAAQANQQPATGTKRATTQRRSFVNRWRR